MTAPSPTDRELLIEAREALQNWFQAQDELREFEKANPNNSTKKWDEKFYAIESAETEALATLARINKHLEG
jgi:hypothetical protein